MKNKLFKKLLVLLIISFPVVQLHAVKQGEVPNVLLLIIDDLNTWQLNRADRYGGKVITPNIRSLAQSGVNFTNAYTASPKCSPSRTAFLYSITPWNSGHTDNGLVIKDNEVLAQASSFIEEFQNAGYFTVMSGKIAHGYDRGMKPDIKFNHRRDPAPPGAPLNGFAVSAGGKLTERDWGATHLAEPAMNDSQKADTAIKALQMKHDKPFIIACGLFLPHMAWYVPQKYLDMYPVDRITYPPLKEDDLDDIPSEGLKLISDTYDKAVAHNEYGKAVQAYLAATTYADAQMGRVLDSLENSPYKDNTIVVLMSDHGFHVGEKKHWQKGTLWEDGSNVLFMVRAPGVTKRGQVANNPVSLLDLYPTLMELTGMDVPEHVEGRSLVPLLKDINTPHNYPVVTAYQNHIAVRTDKYRLIRYSDGEMELYDSRKDPNEWTNIVGNPENMEVVKELSGLLPEFEMLPYVRGNQNEEIN